MTLLVIVTIAASLVAPAPAADDAAQRAAANQAIGSLEAAVKVQSHAEGPRLSRSRAGFLSHFGAPKGAPLSVGAQAKGLTKEGAAREFFATYGAAFGIQNKDVVLEFKSARENKGRTYVRFQQNYQGLPVFAADVVSQVSGSGDIEAVFTDIMVGLKPLDAQDLSTLSRSCPAKDRKLILDSFADFQREKMIKEHPEIHLTDKELKDFPSLFHIEGEPRLVVYSPEVVGNEGVPRIAWLSIIECEKYTLAEAVLSRYDNHEILLSNSLFQNIDFAIYDSENQVNYDWMCDLLNHLDPISGPCESEISDVARACELVNATYTFFNDRVGRLGMDGDDGQIKAVVRVCYGGCPWMNAQYIPPRYFWLFQWVETCGPGLIFGEGLVTDDVVAHEYTHGVSDSLWYDTVQSTVQALTIAESLSDAWGEIFELTRNADDPYPWRIAEETGIEKDPIGCPGVYGLRDMATPGMAPFYDPSTYLGQYWYTGSNNYAYAHKNCGVGNKLWYLLAAGDTHNGYTVWPLDGNSYVSMTTLCDLLYQCMHTLPLAADYHALYTHLTQAAVTLDFSEAARESVEIGCRAVHIRPDPQAPEISSVVINNDDCMTTSLSVTLTITPYGVPTEYRVSENWVDLFSTDWQEYVSNSVQYSLTTLGAGTKYVYVQIRNANGYSAPKYDTIITAMPMINSYAINGGDTQTASRTVTLNHTCLYATPTAYRASENESELEGLDWISTYVTNPQFTILSEDNGTKTIYLQTKNEIDVSEVVSDTIILNENS